MENAFALDQAFRGFFIYILIFLSISYTNHSFSPTQPPIKVEQGNPPYENRLQKASSFTARGPTNKLHYRTVTHMKRT